MRTLANADAELEADRQYRLLRAAIEEMRPFLRADGGDCELVGIDGDLVRIRMGGACNGCADSAATIASVRERLIMALGRLVYVVPIAAEIF